MYGALVVLYMVRDLGFAAGILGTIWALGGLSSLIGAVSAGPATRRFGIGPAMILGLILYSVCRAALKARKLPRMVVLLH